MPLPHEMKRERPADRNIFKYNTGLCTILMNEGSRLRLERLFPMKTPMESRHPGLFCKFHEEIGHDTQDCRNLRKELDGFVTRGYLKQYLCQADKGRVKSPAPLSDDEDIYTFRRGVCSRHFRGISVWRAYESKASKLCAELWVEKCPSNRDIRRRLPTVCNSVWCRPIGGGNQGGKPESEESFGWYREIIRQN